MSLLCNSELISAPTLNSPGQCAVGIGVLAESKCAAFRAFIGREPGRCGNSVRGDFYQGMGQSPAEVDGAGIGAQARYVSQDWLSVRLPPRPRVRAALSGAPPPTGGGDREPEPREAVRGALGGI